MDPELLIQSRRAGAQKVFVLPFKKGELREALLKIQEREDEPSPRQRQPKKRENHSRHRLQRRSRDDYRRPESGQQPGQAGPLPVCGLDRSDPSFWGYSYPSKHKSFPQLGSAGQKYVPDRFGSFEEHSVRTSFRVFRLALSFNFGPQDGSGEYRKTCTIHPNGF